MMPVLKRVPVWADDQPGGTGLGLAISKSIITLHGGTCSVKNTPIGVQFQFYIPY